MKILILTLGSRGDVQPFVALGVGLKKAAHEVTICTSSSFEKMIQEQGLNYAYMNDELTKLAGTQTGRSAIESASHPLSLIKTVIELSQQMKQFQRQMLEEEWQAAQGAEVIIYHPKALGGYHLAEKLNVPALMALPLPFYVPTAAFPNPLLPDLKLGKWYNKLTYKIVVLLNSLQQGIINDWRKKVLNLPDFPLFSNELVRKNGQPVPVLHAYSSHVLPEPADWPDTAITTGYWFLETSKTWQPPADLVEFLAAGPPPVYIGFGSMAGRDPARLTGIVLEALAQTGQRGILAKGWGGLEATTLPETVFQLDAVPHDWLFPQVAAVVHHGGVGTTAAGLRAGKPTIICPFFGDQPFWGRRVFELGVGPRPILQKQLTVENLTAAIQQAATNEKIQQAAANLGEKICSENGVKQAINFIHRYFKCQ
jgi:sterol 3beta-glucosyltransferase